MTQHHGGILIIDFGSQYTQLIARRVREAHVYCEIHPPSRSVEWIKQWQPKGIILSGGPNSVYGENMPTAEPALLEMGTPVLGVCYGMQLLAQLSGGKVVRADRREYGRAMVAVKGGKLFTGFGNGEETPVWMSHGDHVDTAPPGYHVVASSSNAPVAAIQHDSKPLYGVQFHPEVAHTPRGGEILHNFLFQVCGCTPTGRRATSSTARSSGSASSSAPSASSAASPAGWTARWRRCWCTAPSATSSPASSWTTGCCAARAGAGGADVPAQLRH